MIILDVVLLLLLAGFVFYGLFFGLIRTVGSILALVLGVWAAATFYQVAYEWLSSLAFGFEVLGKTVAFFVIFTLVNRVVALIFALLDKTFDFVSIIPFLKTINRVAGAIFGMVEGGFVLGFALYIVQSYDILSKLLEKFSTGSRIVPYLEKFVEILQPILPQLLEQLKHLV